MTIYPIEALIIGGIILAAVVCGWRSGGKDE